jgi:predicted nucleic acid-binding protein
MAPLSVLDTNIIIYFLEGRLAEPLPEGDLGVSIISEIELLSHGQLDKAGEAVIRAFLSSVDLVGLTTPIKEASITLRRQHRLTIPDAIIAATALTTHAELLTNDARLAGVAGVRTRSLPPKA